MIAFFTVIPTCNLHVLHHADIGKFCAGIIKENQTLLLAQITVNLYGKIKKNIRNVEDFDMELCTTQNIALINLAFNVMLCPHEDV